MGQSIALLTTALVALLLSPSICASPALTWEKKFLLPSSLRKNSFIIDLPISSTSLMADDSTSTSMDLESERISKEIYQAYPTKRYSSTSTDTPYRVSLSAQPISSNTFISGTLKKGNGPPIPVTVHCLTKGHVQKTGYEAEPMHAFVREASGALKAQKISNHAVAQTFAVHLSHPTHWMIIQEHTTLTLKKWFMFERFKYRHSPKLAEASLSRLFLSLVKGLDRMSDGKFFQRDLTPDNLFVTTDRNKPNKAYLKIRSFDRAVSFVLPGIPNALVHSAEEYNRAFNHPSFFTYRREIQFPSPLVINIAEAERQMIFQIASILHELLFGYKGNGSEFAQRLITSNEKNINRHIYSFLYMFFSSPVPRDPENTSIPSSLTLKKLLSEYIIPWAKELEAH